MSIYKSGSHVNSKKVLSYLEHRLSELGISTDDLAGRDELCG